jgi:hypothetical protein
VHWRVIIINRHVHINKRTHRSSNVNNSIYARHADQRMAAQEPGKAVLTSVTCSDSYSSSPSLISHHAGHKSCQQVAQQRSTALMTAVTKLIDTSLPPSSPSLFSNPQPASTKSKFKTLHNDNLPSLLQIDRSSQDFHIEMLFLINRSFATLHSHPSFQGASSHIHVEVLHLNCDSSTVGRTM